MKAVREVLVKSGLFDFTEKSISMINSYAQTIKPEDEKLTENIIKHAAPWHLLSCWFEFQCESHGHEVMPI